MAVGFGIHGWSFTTFCYWMAWLSKEKLNYICDIPVLPVKACALPTLLLPPTIYNVLTQ